MSTTQREIKQTYNPLGGVIDLYQKHNGLRPHNFLGLSLMAHLLSIGLVALTLAILQFFGFQIPLFQPLSVKPRDIEFVLVENPEAPPRDPNTRNRAEKASRSGGEKVPNRPQAEQQRAAGQPSPAQRPQPAAQASKPASKPQPQPQRPQQQQQQPRQTAQQPTQRPAPSQQPSPQPSQQPAPQPTPQPLMQRTPTPPAPRATAPTKVASNTPVLPPSPRPSIGTPMPSNPGAVNGPIYQTPAGGSSGGGSSAGGSSSSGAPGPSQIPGSLSSASAGSPGRAGGGGGSGGTGSMNQSGSPGGGGGRAGIDAVAEPDFGPYIAELQRRIKRNWTPPQADRSKRVVAFFTVGRDGRLLSVSLQQSSGTAVADEAAVAAVRASAPFRPLPPEFRGNSIDVQFIFDYDVFSGGGQGKLR